MKPLIYKKADKIGYGVLAVYMLICLSVGKLMEILLGVILGIMMVVA